MNYTLHQLQVFLKVTQTQSITKAAAELHLTQPAVSIQLRKFQDQFDLALTEVVGRRLFITDFGKEIALAAENILNEVAAINHKTLSYKGQLTGRLKISAVSTGKYVMPFFLSDFLKLHPGVELVLDVTNKAKVLESLERNEVDLSLVSVLPDKLQVTQTELMPNKLFLVANRDIELPPPNNPSHIFAHLPMIYREAGSGTRFITEDFIQRNKLPVRKKLELTSNEAVKQAVLAGLGYSIMPLIGIKNELQHGDLQIIPMAGFPLQSMWRLVWLRDKNFSLAASSFLKYVQAEKERIVREKFSWTEQY